MNWTCWYGAMIFVTLFWFLFFGLTIIDHVNVPLVYVGLAAIMVIRAILLCIFCAMLVKDERNRQPAPLSNAAMEPSIEMVRHINAF